MATTVCRSPSTGPAGVSSRLHGSLGIQNVSTASARAADKYQARADVSRRVRPCAATGGGAGEFERRAEIRYAHVHEGEGPGFACERSSQTPQAIVLAARVCFARPRGRSRGCVLLGQFGVVRRRSCSCRPGLAVRCRPDSVRTAWPPGAQRLRPRWTGGLSSMRSSRMHGHFDRLSANGFLRERLPH